MTTTPTSPRPVRPGADRRLTTRRSIPLVVLASLGGIALLTGCTDLGVGLPSSSSDRSAPVRADAPPTPPPASGVITQDQAAQAALAAIGTGRVTWIGPEDDQGAAWEVEITRPNGTEVDVLVAADGRIIATIDKPGDGRGNGSGNGTAPAPAPAPAPPAPAPGPTPPPASGVITQDQAAQAALAAIGTGRVTWIGREDDQGAAWEVEITRPNGTEVDVLVAADGRIIGTIET